MSVALGTRRVRSSCLDQSTYKMDDDEEADEEENYLENDGRRELFEMVPRTIGFKKVLPDKDTYSLKFGPILTHKQCHEGYIGDTVRDSIYNTKSNTTILVLGPKHSGTNFTLNGGCRVRRSDGGANSWMRRRHEIQQTNDDTDTSKNESLTGILPIAVHDLFQSCHQEEDPSIEGGRRTAKVYMSYVTVPPSHRSDETTPRDLLIRFRRQRQQQQDVESIPSFVQDEDEEDRRTTWLLVESTQQVTHILSKVTERRASNMEHTRTLHVILSFQVVMTSPCYDGNNDFILQSAMNTTSTRLTIAKLGTCVDFTQEGLSSPQRWDSSDDDVTNLLLKILDRKRTGLLQKHFGGQETDGRTPLENRLDKLLSDESSALFIFGCVGSRASEDMMGDNIARLRVLVPVTTHAAEPVKMDSPKGVDHSTNDDGPFGIGSITIPSLPDLASNGLLLPQTIVFDSRNRPKLSRATTIAALCRMSTLYGLQLSDATLTGDEVVDSHNSAGTPLSDSNRQLVRKNKSLKASIGRLQIERTKQNKTIESLHEQVNTLNARLLEEALVNEHLEGIREQLNRKVVLLEQRIKILEDERAPTGPIHVSPNTDDGGTPHTAIPSAVGSVDIPIDISAMGRSISIIDASSSGCSIFVSNGDDDDDEMSQRLSASSAKPYLSLKLSESNEISATLDPSQCDVNTNDHSSELATGQFFCCECQASFLASGNRVNIDFFLPRLNMSCLCGKMEATIIGNTDLKLNTLLRPWQYQFLVSAGIKDVLHFISMDAEDRGRLAKELVQWRRDMALDPMPMKACKTALFIWVKACATALNPVVKK